MSHRLHIFGFIIKLLNICYGDLHIRIRKNEDNEIIRQTAAVEMYLEPPCRRNLFLTTKLQNTELRDIAAADSCVNYGAQATEKLMDSNNFAIERTHTAGTRITQQNLQTLGFKRIQVNQGLAHRKQYAKRGGWAPDTRSRRKKKRLARHIKKVIKGGEYEKGLRAEEKKRNSGGGFRVFCEEAGINTTLASAQWKNMDFDAKLPFLLEGTKRRIMGRTELRGTPSPGKLRMEEQRRQNEEARQIFAPLEEDEPEWKTNALAGMRKRQEEKREKEKNISARVEGLQQDGHLERMLRELPFLEPLKKELRVLSPDTLLFVPGINSGDFLAKETYARARRHLQLVDKKANFSATEEEEAYINELLKRFRDTVLRCMLLHIFLFLQIYFSRNVFLWTDLSISFSNNMF